VNTQAYVLTEIGGTWRPALNVPGTTAQSSVASVSCTPAGHCAAGGVNPDSSGHYQAFVVSRT
jgi:hypothetical protein